MEKACFGSGVITSDRLKIGRKDKGKSDAYIKSDALHTFFFFFFICFWFISEVASPLILVGGFFYHLLWFFSTKFRRKKPIFLSFFFNNIMILYILQILDPCYFLVELFLILLIACHLYLFFDFDIFLDFIIFCGAPFPNLLSSKNGWMGIQFDRFAIS